MQKVPWARTTFYKVRRTANNFKFVEFAHYVCGTRKQLLQNLIEATNNFTKFVGLPNNI